MDISRTCIAQLTDSIIELHRSLTDKASNLSFLRRETSPRSKTSTNGATNLPMAFLLT
jgi:hypothetical protein